MPKDVPWILKSANNLFMWIRIQFMRIWIRNAWPDAFPDLISCWLDPEFFRTHNYILHDEKIDKAAFLTDLRLLILPKIFCYWVICYVAGDVYYANHEAAVTQWTHPRTGQRKTVSEKLPFGWERQIGPDNKVTKLEFLHRLNMELDLPKFIWAPCAQLYSLAETRIPPPSPLHFGSYTRVLLVSQMYDISLLPPWAFVKGRCRQIETFEGLYRTSFLSPMQDVLWT